MTVAVRALSRKKAAGRPDPAVAARIEASLTQIEDEALRAALARLGAAIKGA
jgi:hypothetical protein